MSKPTKKETANRSAAMKRSWKKRRAKEAREAAKEQTIPALAHKKEEIAKKERNGGAVPDEMKTAISTMINNSMYSGFSCESNSESTTLVLKK